MSLKEVAFWMWGAWLSGFMIGAVFSCDANAAPITCWAEGTGCALQWTPASGPVQGYYVESLWMSDDCWKFEGATVTPQYTFSETRPGWWRVRVRAYDAAASYGPLSLTSEPIVIPEPPRWMMLLAGCAALAVRR